MKKMKKTLSIVIVGIFILSGIGAVALQKNIQNEPAHLKTTEEIRFSQPVFENYDNEYIQLQYETAESYLMHPGQPMMPQIKKHIELPFGAQHIMVEVTPNRIEEYSISKEIVPAPVPLPKTFRGYNSEIQPVKDLEVYGSDTLYPSNRFSVTTGCGLNNEMKRVTHLSISLYPARYAPTNDKVYQTTGATIKISYILPQSTTNSYTDEYDLLMIAPSEFSTDLQPLINHKYDFNIKTMFKTTDEIYSEYEGRDKPEQIKYFIKDAIENWNITYVLLIGGLTSTVYAKARDTQNYGSSGWHLPVRYTNMEEAGEPGIISDLYYADIYKSNEEGPVFDDWDSNNNDIFAEWGLRGDKLDLYPDVSLGRLACRDTDEVQAVVNKIITYEESPCDPSWFNKIIGVTGDGFLDQSDLNIQWDTNNLPDGEYTIFAQSNNDEEEFGPIDEIQVTLDRTQDTSLTFNHNDHLQIENYPSYPHSPIAEIVSVSNGDILGKDDYTYTPKDPSEAYLNNNYGWANVAYRNGVLYIRGKSYDPKLYGNITDIHVWIENSEGELVFSDWRNETKMYAEGDWTVGDKMLHGRAGSFYYMPDEFEKILLSSANGKWTKMDDVVNEINKGAGFLFFSGHGSPNIWMNHYPGIPGNRDDAEVVGLKVSNLQTFPPFVQTPIFPMDELQNEDKPPIAVVGGCHNSMFSVSGIPAVLHLFYYLLGSNNWMHTYGKYVPETFSWYIVKLPEGGAIASMGNTGYGYGSPGEWCTTGGVDNWITTEFFRQYGVENQQILGNAYSQTLSSYLDEFGKRDSGDVQTVQQWVLLGDPSLKIGGYD